MHSLHPTLKLLKWDYGSLDEHQEKDYIDAKMEIINKGMSKTEVKLNTCVHPFLQYCICCSRFLV